MDQKFISYTARYAQRAENDSLRLAEFEFKATSDTRAADHLQLMLKKLGDTPKVGTVYDQSGDIRQIHIPFGSLDILRCTQIRT